MRPQTKSSTLQRQVPSQPSLAQSCTALDTPPSRARPCINKPRLRPHLRKREPDARSLVLPLSSFRLAPWAPAMTSDLRQACDRCHDKKLRCPKLSDALTCSRCVKAGTPCIFSPPTRPARTGPTMDSLPAGWLPRAVPVGRAPTSSLSPATSISSGPSATEQLTTMILGLDGLLREIPHDDMHHFSQGNLVEYEEQVARRCRPDYVVELLLGHAQHLAQLQPTVVDAALQKLWEQDQDERCLVPNCAHTLRAPLASLRNSKVDCVLLNLLIACNLRLLDLLDALIRGCGTCATTVTLLAPHGYGPKLSIPEVRIGSVVASKSTASSMVISAIFESLIRMLSCAKDTATRLNEASSEAPREVKMLLLQCELLTERTQATFAEMVQLRGQIAGIGLLT